MSKRAGSWDRESRRYSSGSGSLSSSSVITVRGPDIARPSSSSKLLSKSIGGTAAIAEVKTFRGSSPNHQSSPSKRLSNTSNGTIEGFGREYTGNPNRWSQSSSNNQGLGHLRSSSFSRRFSLAVPSPNSSLRSPSPPKSRETQQDERRSPSKRAIAATSSNSQRSPPVSYPRTDRFETTYQRPANDSNFSSEGGRNQVSGNQNGISHGHSLSRNPTQELRPGSSGMMLAARNFSETDFKSQPIRGAESPQRQRAVFRHEAMETGNQSRSENPTPASINKPFEKHKKALLSEALQRANDAVQLDNDADYYEAVIAYKEACSLLNDVMTRSSSAEDQRKLTAIRGTYMTRVQELQPLVQRKSRSSSQNAGSRPGTSDSKRQRYGLDQLESAPDMRLRDESTPLITQSLKPLTTSGDDGHNGNPKTDGSARTGNAFAGNISPSQSSTGHVPPPLSPRRSPNGSSNSEMQSRDNISTSSQPPQPENENGDQRHRSKGSDTGTWSTTGAAESTSRASSNHHSVSSVTGLRRRDLKNHDDTEAEFDAALDAAVEAAYNEGYEPYDGNSLPEMQWHQDREARIQSEKNAAAVSNFRHASLPTTHDNSDAGSVVDSDEEERLLDQVTRGFPDDAHSEAVNKPRQPRQSDSSGFSNRTYGSSVASSLTTAGTSLSTVDEMLPVPPPPIPKAALAKSISSASHSINNPPIPQHPGNAFALDDYSANLPDGYQNTSPKATQSRPKGLSANTKKLKIETTGQLNQRNPDMKLQSPTFTDDLTKINSADSLKSPKTAPPGHILESRLSPADISLVSQKSASLSGALQISAPYPSPFAGNFPLDAMSPYTSAGAVRSNDNTLRDSPLSEPTASPYLSSDRNLKQSNSTSNLTRLISDTTDPSPATPMSFSFSTAASPRRHQDDNGRQLSDPNIDVPTQTKIKLFDNNIHLKRSGDDPKPLEPCPESLLLRPFWLMRCFYQTLAHPKGGYISNKLFVPHDVWKVKAPKLKSIEDKISICDYLTAALLKLSTVDPLDADAIHEEMIAFEQLLDESQISLSKKLGGDVGTQTVSGLFKGANSGPPPSTFEGQSHTNVQESKSTSTGSQAGNSRSGSKTWQSSWRKLRNKNSSPGLASGHVSTRDGVKETSTMSSLPMISLEVSRTRPMKRQVSGNSISIPRIDGPNSNYASSIAKLCDAVQVLDHIARQVEDPGLKMSSPTHVGLELSARHSAEFFGFYICRFILQDLMMLMDKFLKRATEWVLA